MHGVLGVIKAAVSLSSLTFSHAGISQASWRQHPAPQRPSHPRGTPGKPKPAAVCSAQGPTHSPVPCGTVLLPHPRPHVVALSEVVASPGDTWAEPNLICGKFRWPLRLRNTKFESSPSNCSLVQPGPPQLTVFPSPGANGGARGAGP